jgi:transposase
MLADALGRPLRFRLAPGQEHDIVQAPAMIEGFEAKTVLADTAYDSRAFRDAVQAIGAEPVIPSNPTRKHPFQHDRHRYKLRNRIERCFNKLKHFRRLATRYDRRAVHFLAFIHLAAAMLWMP